MISPPQCKTRAECLRRYADVLDMCAKEGFERPWRCVHNQYRVIDKDHTFDDSPEHYEFFLCFVEGRPVFRDSEMYRADNGWQCHWDETGKSWQDEVGNWQGVNGFALSWSPPKPSTLEINGVEVNAPRVVETSSVKIKGYPVVAWFECAEDAEAAKAALEGKK